MGKDFLQSIEIISPDVSVDSGRFNNRVEHHLSIFWFVPLGMNPFPMQPYSPGLLYQVPNRVGDVVIDMTDDIDEYNEEFEERVKYPAIGHVSA